MVNFCHHRLIYSIYCNYYFSFSNELQRGSRLRLRYLGDALCILTKKEFESFRWRSIILSFVFCVLPGGFKLNLERSRKLSLGIEMYSTGLFSGMAL